MSRGRWFRIPVLYGRIDAPSAALADEVGDAHERHDADPAKAYFSTPSICVTDFNTICGAPLYSVMVPHTHRRFPR